MGVIRARRFPGTTSQVGDSLSSRSPRPARLLEKAEAPGGAGWVGSSAAAPAAAGEPAPSQLEHAGRARRVAASAQTFPLQCGVPRAPPITAQLRRDVCSSPPGRAGQRFGAQASLAKVTFQVSCLHGRPGSGPRPKVPRSLLNKWLVAVSSLHGCHVIASLAKCENRERKQGLVHTKQKVAGCVRGVGERNDMNSGSGRPSIIIDR